MISADVKTNAKQKEIREMVAVFSNFLYKNYLHLLVTTLKPYEGLSKKLKPPKG